MTRKRCSMGRAVDRITVRGRTMRLSEYKALSERDRVLLAAIDQRKYWTERLVYWMLNPPWYSGHEGGPFKTEWYLQNAKEHLLLAESEARLPDPTRSAHLRALAGIRPWIVEPEQVETEGDADQRPDEAGG